MQLCNTVDCMASDDCQICHPHALGVGLLDDADFGDCLVVHREVCHGIGDEA